MLSRRYAFDGKATLNLNATQIAARDRVARKIAAGEYAFEGGACVVCGGSQFEALAEQDRYGLYTPVSICQTCGLIQTNPHMTQAAYTDFYNTDYRRLYVGSETATEAFFRDQYRLGGSILSYLTAHGVFAPGADKLVLEVGCGAGGILKAFGDQGCRTVGIDIGEEYAAYGQQHHRLDLRVGTLDTLTLDARPDLVIYADVLEHILTPRRELQTLAGLLSPDSLLYVAMPGVKSLFWKNPRYRMDFLRLLQNAHVWHFSLTTLQNLLGTARFALVVGDEDIRSVFRVSAAGDIPITNDYAAAMRALHRLEAGRRLFPLPYLLGRLRAYGIRQSIGKGIQRLRRG